MASTYVLISSNVLASSTASVTFSSIPQTYTDIIVSMSVRTDQAVQRNLFNIFPNSETTSSTNGSQTSLYNNGSSASSAATSSSYPYRNIFDANGSSSTASTFSSVQIYIPNYTSTSNYKPASTFGASENNSTGDAFVGLQAELYSSTSAITQLVITTSGFNWVSGSSFYLYGIKNS